MVGMQTEQTNNRITVNRDRLIPDLKKVIRKGLPITEVEDTGEFLLHLRNVASRSIDPQDIYGRLDALNYLLPKLINAIDDNQLGPAARILFGMADSTRGSTLTVRRERCAAMLDYDLDHFRKRVELQILERVALEVHRDLVRYRRRLRRPVEAFETTRPTPGLLSEDVSREEELLSRIWQHLYAVRAEEIAIRLAITEVDRSRHQEHQEAAALALQQHIRKYLDVYGREYISDGHLEYSVQGLERLVVWRLPGFSAEVIEDQRI